MPAYYNDIFSGFVKTPVTEIAEKLSKELISHFSGNYQEQLKAWQSQIEILQKVARTLLHHHPSVANWAVFLEYPLLRLQQRLDSVALAGQVIAVIEFKIGANRYDTKDVRQVEDYALDLRDFHSTSQHLTIVPILCATDAPTQITPTFGEFGTVWPVHFTNADSLASTLEKFAEIQEQEQTKQLDWQFWNEGQYRPVPTIVEAAKLLYAGHRVEEIAHSAASDENLQKTANRIIEIASIAKANSKKVICFITGIPGSGKTLAGLNVVHDERIKTELRTTAAYLSGNSPLVEVLREALARDRHERTEELLRETRRIVRTEIQHLMDYVREYIAEHPDHTPPENVIVFDEAQRAWDAAYGKQKFNRAASEPTLFLEIMNRCPDWALIVALVGGGQEINSGEKGLREWGIALADWSNANPGQEWAVFGAPDAIFGGESTIGHSLFNQGYDYPGALDTDTSLHLETSIRNFKCESLSQWVTLVLHGHIDAARKVARSTLHFPVFITRSLSETRSALEAEARGSRRVGLVASSGARRLRADGLGVTLSAGDKDAYVHWYLEPKGDIRSSNALEVTANEYTCQGLELDYVGLSWGGDMLWSNLNNCWEFRELHGARWKTVRKSETQLYIQNTYRVLMTRSRRGMVIWVPEGSADDITRDPKTLNATADVFTAAGAIPLAPSAKSQKNPSHNFDQIIVEQNS